MQLTMEPLDEMLASARAMDRAGMDTIWLAEAYPWWRKHGMEARSSTVTSALIARETERLTVGWGIISPFTRHPVQIAMDARVVQEAAGPERFLLGLGTSKIFQNIKGAADTLLELAGLEQDEIRPVAEAMERGGRLAAKAEVTDAILDKCRPIAGTPGDCIEAIEEYRDAGCTHVMLELWGDRRPEQIRLFGEEVLPHFRS